MPTATAERSLSESSAVSADPRELEAEAGPSTGEIQDEHERQPLPDVDEIRVDGTAQLSMFNLGGKLATSASLTLSGGKVALVEGQAFQKGDRIKLSIEAVVNDVGQKDAHDPKTGQVVSCEQRHRARIVDLILESAS